MNEETQHYLLQELVGNVGDIIRQLQFGDLNIGRQNKQPNPKATTQTAASSTSAAIPATAVLDSSDVTKIPKRELQWSKACFMTLSETLHEGFPALSSPESALVLWRSFYSCFRSGVTSGEILCC